MVSDSERQEEIVLGNKQLLSIFFIVVVLLGVAFTIGYMIGKNTATVSASSGNTPGSAPVPVAEDSRFQPRSIPSAAPAAAEAESTPAEAPTPSPDQPKPTGTHAAQPYGDATSKAASSEPSTTTEDAKPLQAAATSGTYLQVAALKHDDAAHIMRMLQERGFPSRLGESPKEGLFRVLVGPFQTMPEVSESKQKLRAAGFDSIIAR